MKKILLIFLITICTLSLNSCIVFAQNNESLMIVAHPDDETIWGGEHLIHGNYTVLCITNGNNKKRKAEFQKVMKEAHSHGIILSYPDKTNGKRDSWKSCHKEIEKEIKKLIDSKSWNYIVTHNPKGEYGHIHHKMVSRMVTKIAKKEDKTKQVLYFGRYVKRNKKQNLKFVHPMSNNHYKEKRKLCKLYTSQKKVLLHLHHMLKYENWIPYSDWSKIK